MTLKLRPYQVDAIAAIREQFDARGLIPMRIEPAVTGLGKAVLANLQSLRMSGRLANGSERDAGQLWHAVPIDSNKAVCGAKPGRRSVGWGAEVGKEYTCKGCIKRLGVQAKETT